MREGIEAALLLAIICLRSLVNDCVRKPAYAEQGRDAAHSFRMPKADVTARQEAIIEVLRRNPPRDIIKINQHVTAKHNIEAAIASHFTRIDQIGVRKLYRIPQAGCDM